jgi:hypothetical protein
MIVRRLFRTTGSATPWERQPMFSTLYVQRHKVKYLLTETHEVKRIDFEREKDHL